MHKPPKHRVLENPPRVTWAGRAGTESRIGQAQFLIFELCFQRAAPSYPPLPAPLSSNLPLLPLSSSPHLLLFPSILCVCGGGRANLICGPKMKDQGRPEIWPLPFLSLNLGSGLSLFNVRSRAETHGFLGNGAESALDPSPALSLSLSPSADGPPVVSPPTPVGESSRVGCPQSFSG